MRSLEIEPAMAGEGNPRIRRRQLNEIERSWLLAPQEPENRRGKNWNCIVAIAVGIFIVMSIITVRFTHLLPSHHHHPPPILVGDDYTQALQKALQFFDAQQSGKLPKNHSVSWRGDSGLKDDDGLKGGYYNGGSNIKFHFPMAYSMTMLSWSLIEYSHKLKAVDEYDHMRHLLKWGTDYLLRTFDSSTINYVGISTQVGYGLRNSKSPNDMYCWQRPEDMSYKRTVSFSLSATDLGGEVAAALASASIVFSDEPLYAAKLKKGGETLWSFITDVSRRKRYSDGKPNTQAFYNSTSIYDELMWAGAWLYYATGKTAYIQLATEPRIARRAKVSARVPELMVPSWDNKLPGAMLLMTRFRVFLSPGYPYEEMLQMYHTLTEHNMCAYLKEYHVFNWTSGGLIQLNMEKPRPLEYVVHASFLASLFADYLESLGVPGWYCGPTFFRTHFLKDFAKSQIDYVLGKNPLNMSYVVGFGNKFPRHVYHRGASIPNDKKRRNCTEGFKYRDTKKPNPHNITGAMVGGPNKADQFDDIRSDYNEPTLSGNAGLVAALISLTSSGGDRIDKNTLFNNVPPMYTPSPPPPEPWRP